MNRLPEKAFMFHQPAIAFFGNGATKGCAEKHMGTALWSQHDTNL
jgi:hypothetical protein